MARKRKNLRQFKKDSPEYWEEILARRNLTMSEGLDGGHELLIHVGSATDLERVYQSMITAGGRTAVKESE